MDGGYALGRLSLNAVQETLKQGYGSPVHPRISATVARLVSGLQIFDHIRAARAKVWPEALEGNIDVITPVASVIDDEVERTICRDECDPELPVALVPLHDSYPVFKG